MGFHLGSFLAQVLVTLTEAGVISSIVMQEWAINGVLRGGRNNIESMDHASLSGAKQLVSACPLTDHLYLPPALRLISPEEQPHSYGPVCNHGRPNIED